jgi:hypothetical protein
VSNVVLVLEGLTRKKLKRMRVKVRPSAGFTQTVPSPDHVFVTVPVGIAPGEEVTVQLRFRNPLRRKIRFIPRLLSVSGGTL